jgi:hypothetical protein
MDLASIKNMAHSTAMEEMVSTQVGIKTLDLSIEVVNLLMELLFVQTQMKMVQCLFTQLDMIGLEVLKG